MESMSVIDKKNKKNKNVKREDYLSWDEYFMALSILSSLRSKDPNTRVGACIVNSENRIVGIGYNGFPAGCSDDELPWGREGEWENTKYPYVCHAEMNAILNSDLGRMSECRLYVSLFPCNECAKMIIQSGLKQVIYISDKYPEDQKFITARRMFKLAGITLKQMDVPKEPVTINFSDWV